MPTTPIIYPAPAWTPSISDEVVLFHGCTKLDADQILSSGIDLSKCRVDTDFGRGFYTTTIEYQARQWAWNRFYDPGVNRNKQVINYPVVLEFHLDRHWLADLTNISFVLGMRQRDTFWSLVQHCRQSTPSAVCDHNGPQLQPDGTHWYDVACGPVAAFWTQQYLMQDADQYSFHTSKAIRLLNQLIKGSSDQSFRVTALE